MTIQKFFTSRSNAEADDFVGQAGRLWFDEDTQTIYYSDGVTPGGIPITSGSSGPGVSQTFETISKNLSANPYVINRDVSNKITSIVYSTASAGDITKTLNYTGTLISGIQLSGPSLPLILVKTLTYANSQIVSASYSTI